MRTTSEPRKIAFLGQQEYYNCLYGDTLDDLYEVRKFQLIWGAPWYHYTDLVAFQPDIAFFFRPELHPPELIERINGICVGLSSEPMPYHHQGKLIEHPDTIARWESISSARAHYDFIFHFNGVSIPYMRERGMQVEGEFVFPVDTEMYHPIPDAEKKWDAIFVGRSTDHRERLLGPLKRDFRVLHVSHGLIDDELVRFINASHIALNIHVEDYLTWEHRIQNYLACGTLVMSETLTPNDTLIPGQDYVAFSNPQEFFDKFLYYLRNRREAEMIARNGLEKVRKKLSAKRVFPHFIDHIWSLAHERNLLQGEY